MNRLLTKLVIAATFAAGASAAFADEGAWMQRTPSAQNSANTFATLQAESSNSSWWQPQSAPPIDTGPRGPVAALTFSEMEGLSSSAPAFHPRPAAATSLAQVPADPVPPHGFTVAQYQALSSESPMWQLRS